MRQALDGQIVSHSPAPAAPDAAAGPSATADAATGIVLRVGVGVRPATPADVPLIDAMQKAQANVLGFLPTAALLGKIGLGQVLLAVATG